MEVTLSPSSVISPLFLLLLALPSNPCASTAERCNISRNVHFDDDVCLISSYANATGLSNSVISPDDIEFILRDRTSGILEVKFPILKKYVTYELRLNVIEDVKKQEECNKVHLNNTFLHSIRLFDVFSCKDDLDEEHCDSAPACTKFSSVTFSHVFGGCYLLHITPKNNSSSGQPTTCRRMIDSDHNKTVIWNKKPSVADQSYPDELRLSFFNFATLFELGLEVMFYLFFGDCGDFGAIKQGWVLALTDNNTQLHCETKDGYYHPYCELVSNYSDSLGSVACTFYNMTPGQYCVILEPIDRDRCHPGTVWTRGLERISPCKYQHTFTFRKRNVQNQDPVALSANHNNTLIVIGSVGALTALVILGLAMYSGLHYSFPGSSADVTSFAGAAESTVEKINSKPLVLLLYALDCPPFMKLMSTFRTLLSQIGQCEVFDCFDPACIEDIAPAPEEWMLNAASTCRVVIAINGCGVELQKKTNAHSYKYPTPFCQLFLVGLKHVMGSITSREYCRVFVVRFDNEDLNCITPHIRFLLPHNSSDLLRHLNPNCDLRVLEDSKDHQKLKDDIQEFLVFKKENPNYVRDLLMFEDNL